MTNTTRVACFLNDPKNQKSLFWGSKTKVISRSCEPLWVRTAGCRLFTQGLIILNCLCCYLARSTAELVLSIPSFVARQAIAASCSLTVGGCFRSAVSTVSHREQSAEKANKCPNLSTHSSTSNRRSIMSWAGDENSIIQYFRQDIRLLLLYG